MFVGTLAKCDPYRLPCTFLSFSYTDEFLLPIVGTVIQRIDVGPTRSIQGPFDRLIKSLTVLARTVVIYAT